MIDYEYVKQKCPCGDENTAIEIMKKFGWEYIDSNDVDYETSIINSVNTIYFRGFSTSGVSNTIERTNYSILNYKRNKNILCYRDFKALYEKYELCSENSIEPKLDKSRDELPFFILMIFFAFFQ